MAQQEAQNQQNPNMANIMDGSKKIPTFYGQADKDTITAEMFLEQAENIGTAMNWSQDLLCRNIYMALGGQAKLRAQEMREDYEYVPHIDTYKKLFKIYSPLLQPGELLLQFNSLQMKKNEPVIDYEIRVRQMVRRMMKSRTAKPPLRFPDEVWDTFTNLQKRHIMERDTKQQARERKQNQEDQIFELFMGYIASPYKEELRRLKPKTAEEALDLAITIEKQTQGDEKKFTLPLCNTQEASLDKNEEESTRVVDTLTRQMAEVQAALCRMNPRNNQGFSRNRSTQGNRSTFNRSSKHCTYCNKKGHTQDECYTRQNRNAPCKDKDGKEYYPQGNGQRKYITKHNTVVRNNPQDFQ